MKEIKDYTVQELFDMKLEETRYPKGSISKKIINGKDRYYLQWKENGENKSKYIPNNDIDNVRNQLARKKELKELITKIENAIGFYDTDKIRNEKFDMNVVYGAALRCACAEVMKYEKRDNFEKLKNFMQKKPGDKVFLIYGLRRTGKTTLMRQSINALSQDEFSRTVYIKATVKNTISDLNSDLQKLWNIGVRNVYLDEVTLIEDFIDCAALLSDIYAPTGMRIVCSGTDSLGFYFTDNNELYDRNVMIHTTYISFKEHSRLLKTNNVDEYIEYGGTLKAGAWDFDNTENNKEDLSFRDDESTRKYVDIAISKNIQNSLKHYDNGNHFGYLSGLYEKGLLTNVINRVVEDMNHSFVVNILTKKFKSNDLHLESLTLLHDPNVHVDLLKNIDEENVTEMLMNILEIRNTSEEQNKIYDKNHEFLIKEYLERLDLLKAIEKKSLVEDELNSTIYVVTQPGLRYCQAKALTYSLLKDKKFSTISDEKKILIIDRILNEVKGRMLEEIVLYDTQQKLKGSKEVFKLGLFDGEYDMVIHDCENFSIELYEIKHSDKIVSRQAQHLRNDKFLKLVRDIYGDIKRRCVLYMGEDHVEEDGIEYKNVNEFLKE